MAISPRLISLNFGSQTVGLAEFRVQAHGGLVLLDYRLREAPLDPATGQRSEAHTALHETAAALREMMGPCRCAIQPGSLYEIQVLPATSCQTSTFNGRSIPTVWTDCMSGVPPRALPKIISSVGRNFSPTSAAPAAWSIRANTFIPL